MEQSASSIGTTEGGGTKRREVLGRAVVRFSGDSGDGMQVTGSQFTSTAALFGNDLATFPDYPAEIRAPAGTVPGVSGFQVHFSSSDVFTPGDAVDALIAMNPAALKVNLRDLKKNGILIVNADSFEKADLEKAGLDRSPLDDHTLEGYRVFKVELTRLTRAALRDLGLDTRSMDRCKNFFALGMCYWLYNRSLEPTERFLEEKFARKPAVAEANKRALRAGYAYCDVTEAFQVSYEIPPAKLSPGTYRNISGNVATALGLVAAAERAGLQLFLGSYPITPASDILHELSELKEFGVLTFQAEDEIAAMCAALGAAYAGSLAVTSTSGPGMALKMEAIGLAIATELPVVIVDVQRGGPSTGLPTKTEQADLFQALYGRNSEAPLPVVAPATPGDCFAMAFEASRLALSAMTPVIVLSDGYLANGSEPWRVPEVDALPALEPRFRTDPMGFMPFARDEATLARPWAIPGTAGLVHRIGGLEKQDGSGHISYDAANHERMVKLRAEKVARLAKIIPPVTCEGDADAELLVVGWGSTYGAIAAAVRAEREAGRKVAHAHLRHLNPLPSNLGEVLARHRRVLIPEMNLGQLEHVLRARFGGGRPASDLVGFHKVQGQPFMQAELQAKIEEVLP